MKVIVIIVAIVVAFVLNLLLGSVDIPVGDILRILIGDDSVSVISRNIIMQSRVPQALTATVAGAGLAVSGCRWCFAIRWQVRRCSASATEQASVWPS